MTSDPASTVTDLRQRVVLGRTGLRVSRLGIAASYGVGADAVVQAYEEQGINYLYWGSMRRRTFGDAIRRISARHRDDLVVVVQTYTRLAAWMAPSLHRALRELRLDHADVLLLGMFNRLPSRSITDAALELKRKGLVRFLAVSCHRRPAFAEYVKQGVFDVLMFRFNAVHRGAEQEVLPLFGGEGRPGTVAYTATRWGHLLDPRRIPGGEKVPRASDCYRFVLSHDPVDVCLAGPSDAEQLREALSALDRGPMTQEELSWMRRIGDHIHGRGAGLNLLERMMHRDA